MTLYFRPFINSGLTIMYSDSGVNYQIDWVLVQLGTIDACVILS